MTDTGAWTSECVYAAHADRGPDLFDHEKLAVYQKAVYFVAWAEEACKAVSGRAAAREHLGRASSSMPVNIAEASGKTSSKERGQFVDTACGSALECAACLDVLSVRAVIRSGSVSVGKAALVEIVSMLVGLRKSNEWRVMENSGHYGNEAATVMFSHEKLNVYQRALEFVAWCKALEDANDLAGQPATALDRSSTGIVLNIAEGNGKFSARDRCRFISHARTSSLQAAAHLDVLCARRVLSGAKAGEGRQLLRQCVRMLVAWDRSLRP